MSKVKVRSVYEQVEQGIFVEGFAYASEEQGNYEVAVALQGVERGDFFEIVWTLEAHIKDIRENKMVLFADHPEMLDIYSREIAKLQRFIDAVKRLGL
jgi:hypothetical protein